MRRGGGGGREGGKRRRERKVCLSVLGKNPSATPSPPSLHSHTLTPLTSQPHPHPPHFTATPSPPSLHSHTLTPLTSQPHPHPPHFTATPSPPSLHSHLAEQFGFYQDTPTEVCCLHPPHQSPGQFILPPPPRTRMHPIRL